MKPVRHTLLAVVMMALVCVAVCASADAIDKDWTFSEPGNLLGWYVDTICIPQSGVSDGHLWLEATNVGCTAYISGPDYLGIPASPGHYAGLTH